jgi:hypothetical protein
MPWRRFSLTGMLAVQACLTMICRRWSWSEHGPTVAVSPHERLRAATGRTVSANLIDNRPADVFQSSTEAKRKALEVACQGIVTSNLPEWNQDPGLLDWLTSL